jgi:DNA mismatch endonuclease (patch repair protein)
MDIWSKEKRSEVMSKIRSKNTKPEKLLRSLLHKSGYRFRIHKKDLPGKPDVVLTKYKTVIFVHGCFWHSHKKCQEGKIPKTNVKFWTDKLQKNILRDREHSRKLKKDGWKVITVWECELEKNPNNILKRIFHSLKTRKSLTYPP